MIHKENIEIYNALKNLGIEIRIADNSPCWAVCEKCGIHGVDDVPNTLKGYIEDGVNNAEADSEGYYCGLYPGNNGGPFEIKFIPDYGNAANSLVAFRELKEYLARDCSDRGIEWRCHSIDWTISETDSEALFKLLQKRLGLVK